MARFRNDFGQDRVVPTLGYHLVPAGEQITVPDEEWDHWDAGGWTALDPRPEPPAEPASEPEAAPAEPAPVPPSPKNKAAAGPAAEGDETP